MSEPKRIQVIRSHQSIKDFIYQSDNDSSHPSSDQFSRNQNDYYTIGWKRLGAVQSLPLKENWPIVVGNAVASFSSGFLGGMITNRMARNLSLHISLSTRPTAGACFFVVTISHLSVYYYLVLRPMFSNDPMLCRTCLEIRSFAIGSFVPLIMGTNIAVLANLSSCLLNKTLRLPQFHIRAYPEWLHFFRKHAFKGMSRRHFFAYPIINGFLASMIFLGQDYYWRNYLQQRLDSLDEHPLPQKEPQQRNKVFGSVQDFFTKLFSSKTR